MTFRFDFAMVLIDDEHGEEKLMKIYFAWSGDKSSQIATVLGEWISQVIQAVEPWISTKMDKGARWQEEIGNRLEEAKVGIVCLTPENLTSAWIHFEAGALSKIIKNSHVCTFLLNLAPNNVKQPLSQFQHTIAKKEDVRRLLQTINKLVAVANEKALTEKNLDKLFEMFWPDLEQKLKDISKRTPAPPVRDQREVLDELLTVVRDIRRSQAEFQQLKFTPGSYETLAGSTIIVTPASPSPEVPPLAGIPRLPPRKFELRQAVRGTTSLERGLAPGIITPPLRRRIKPPDDKK